MINRYDKKMGLVYLRHFLKTMAGRLQLWKWKWWQKLNSRFLHTYPLIKDCARCKDCGRNVYDFTVSSNIWEKVIDRKGGVWCYDCFCNRANEKGITIQLCALL